MSHHVSRKGPRAVRAGLASRSRESSDSYSAALEPTSRTHASSLTVQRPPLIAGRTADSSNTQVISACEGFPLNLACNSGSSCPLGLSDVLICSKNSTSLSGGKSPFGRGFSFFSFFSLPSGASASFPLTTAGAASALTSASAWGCLTPWVASGCSGVDCHRKGSMPAHGVSGTTTSGSYEHRLLRCRPHH